MERPRHMVGYAACGLAPLKPQFCDCVEVAKTSQAQVGMKTIIRWVPAHSKVEGNEMANRAAKEATKNADQTTQPQPQSQSQSQLQPRLQNVAWRCEKQAIDKAKYFDRSKSGKFTKQIDKALPGNHVHLLYDRLTKEDAQILAQLRTGKCRLRSYLASFGAEPSPNCKECGVPETVEHFLLRCRRWSSQRNALTQAAGDRNGDLSYLLGGWSDAKPRDGNYVDGPRARWKPDLRVVAATIAFAKATQRLATTNQVQ